MRRASTPPSLRLAVSTMLSHQAAATLPHPDVTPTSTPTPSLPSTPPTSVPASPQITPSPFRATTPIPTLDHDVPQLCAFQPSGPRRSVRPFIRNVFQTYETPSVAGQFEQSSRKHRTPREVTEKSINPAHFAVNKGTHARHRDHANPRYTALGELLERTGAYSIDFEKYYSEDELDHSETIPGLIRNARIGEEGRKGEADPWLTSLTAVQNSLDDCDRATTYLRRALEKVSLARHSCKPSYSPFFYTVYLFGLEH